MKALVAVVVAAVVAFGVPPAPATPYEVLPIGTMVAMGDSYTSGEGVPPFVDETDLAGINECHRSEQAYPEIVAQTMGIPVTSWACSGATVADLSSRTVGADQAPWDDPARNVPVGTRAAAVDRVNAGTSIVVLTIGGNDLGFGEIVADCLLEPVSCTRHDDAVQQELLGLPGKLQALFGDLTIRLPSSARVLVMGYPRVFPSADQADCDFLTFLPTGTFSASEQAWANDATALMNGVVRRAVEQADRPAGPEFRYVDAWDAFAGSELCLPLSGSGLPATTSPLINGVDLVNFEHSFHPSAAGHRVLAARLLAAVGAGAPSGEGVGLVDPSTGIWNLRDATGTVFSFYYGNPGDSPVVGDWDCDGVDTPGLFRRSDGFVYLRNSNTQGVADRTFFFGDPGDVPLAGDMNGDGCDTVSVYRPSEQRVYVINELGEDGGGLGAADFSFVFGNPGDQPVVGDWDGDGIDEVGLHRDTTGLFYWRTSLTTGIADGSIYFGDPGDRFVAGDWGTVDGRDTPAVFRPSNQTFYFRHSLTEGVADSQFVWPGADAQWHPVAGAFGS